MTLNIEQIENEALQLPTEARIRLIQRLQQRLQQFTPEKPLSEPRHFGLHRDKV